MHPEAVCNLGVLDSSTPPKLVRLLQTSSRHVLSQQPAGMRVAGMMAVIWIEAWRVVLLLTVAATPHPLLREGGGAGGEGGAGWALQPGCLSQAVYTLGALDSGTPSAPAGAPAADQLTLRPVPAC